MLVLAYIRVIYIFCDQIWLPWSMNLYFVFNYADQFFVIGTGHCLKPVTSSTSFPEYNLHIYVYTNISILISTQVFPNDHLEKKTECYKQVNFISLCISFGFFFGPKYCRKYLKKITIFRAVFC